MISTSTKPRWRATSTRSYWRRLLSRLVITWDCVDWRTYTTALRLSTVAGSRSALVIGKLLDAHAGCLQQHLSQRRYNLAPLQRPQSVQSAGVEQQVHLSTRDR